MEKMSGKPLSKKSRKIAQKKAAKPTNEFIIAGSYKERQLAWIKKNGIYNYPVRAGDEFNDDALRAVKELWLFADVKSTRHAFAVKGYVGKMTKQEFVAKYPSYKKPTHDAYYIFEVTKLDYEPTVNTEIVIARTADFGRRTAKIKKAIEQFKQDGEYGPLAAYLPKQLSKVPPKQLRVSEEAVQLDFFWSSATLLNKSNADGSKQIDTSVTVMEQPPEPAIGIQKYIDKIINGDSAEVLRSFPDNSVDLVVTSPPYDQIRDYNGFTLNLHAIGAQLYRVVKEGGVVAMVIQDSTKNFAKTLTSFRTIVDWCDNIGFKMFETVIYHKNGTEGAWWTHRFRVDHEYMPIFFKGEKPQYFNKEPLKIPSKWGGKVMTGSGNRRTSGETTQTVTRPINMMKCRGTVWDYMMAGDKNPLKRKHPAVFPDKIPYDFIQCFCPPDGIVLDPFVGCGSTAVTAKGLGRHYIGVDISEEYCKLAEERVRVDSAKYAQQQLNI